MMQLSFSQSHLSITQFPDIELPDFTLITGANGAGKSHLLQALHLGSIRTDLAPEQSRANQTSIRLFDWSNLVPQDNGHFSSESFRQERQNLLNQFNGAKRQQEWLEPARSIIRPYNLEDRFLIDPSRLTNISADELQVIFGEGIDTLSVMHRLRETLASSENDFVRHLDQNSQVKVREVAAYSNRPLFLLTDTEIMSPTIPSWGQSDLFQQSFGRLFVAYRDLRLANRLAELRFREDETATYLTDADFVRLHGTPPWEFVNASLDNAHLDFEINSPNPDDYSSFQPSLTKRSTGTAISFSALSSGEKVLMSFAFCVYYANDKRQLAVQPKVILLDEIDAPLHPSMSKSVIETITNTLVGKFNIKIIATTHSPSTVALAPEPSIFTMSAGEPGLRKSSKAAALNVLTVGVPTLAISFDGRRQVFVESPTDARIYDTVYKILKPGLISDRSLEFIATGTRTPSGDVNTGCVIVRRLVDDLSAAGNTSVFGLIDWDGANEPSNRISVLAYGRRNGIENILLDPLLIGLFICRNFPLQKDSVGLQAHEHYVGLVKSDGSAYAGIATRVSEHLFGPAEELVTTRYRGGLELAVDKRYLEIDDHTLENLILDRFTFLRAASRGQAGKLMQGILDTVLAENDLLVPSELEEVIEQLLNRPSHDETFASAS